MNPYNFYYATMYIFEGTVKHMWKSGAGTGSVVECEAVMLANTWQNFHKKEILALLSKYSCSCFEAGIANPFENKYKEKADKNLIACHGNTCAWKD